MHILGGLLALIAGVSLWFAYVYEYGRSRGFKEGELKGELRGRAQENDWWTKTGDSVEEELAKIRREIRKEEG